MKFWNAHDLAVVDLREKIIILTDEFENKFGKNTENYNRKLDSYLNRRLKQQANFILKTGISEHKIYKFFDGWREACELAGIESNKQKIKIEDDGLSAFS